MLLSKAETDAITARSGELEARIGVQVIAAITPKADAHVELPWKAFALGAVLAGLAMVVADAVRPQWLTANATLINAVSILSARRRERLAGGFRSHLRVGSSCARPGAMLKFAAMPRHSFCATSCSRPAGATAF